MNKIDQNHIEYENYNTQLYDKVYFNTDSGGYVVVHKLHGKQERAENVEIAKILADAGKRVELLPVDNTLYKKNPDAKVDGQVFEFKENKTYTGTSIQREIRKAKGQAPNIVLYFKKEISKWLLINSLKDKLLYAKSIKKIVLIIQKRVYETTSKEILNGYYKIEWGYWSNNQYPQAVAGGLCFPQPVKLCSIYKCKDTTFYYICKINRPVLHFVKV